MHLTSLGGTNCIYNLSTHKSSYSSQMNSRVLENSHYYFVYLFAGDINEEALLHYLYAIMECSDDDW